MFEQFDPFTDRARRVVIMANDEARQLNHSYIGTEHLLLGLLREGEGVAATALNVLGVSLDGVRQRVEETIGRGGTNPGGHIPFTPSAQQALEGSLQEALQSEHRDIGPEHILLGLLRQDGDAAIQILVALGTDADQVRRQVHESLP
jgi:ATP-dependent Clp protease ATP-binding subunit ClpC